MAGIQIRLFHGPDLAGLIRAQGWATRAEIDELVAFMQDWAGRPDAFLAIMC